MKWFSMCLKRLSGFKFQFGYFLAIVNVLKKLLDNFALVLQLHSRYRRNHNFLGELNWLKEGTMSKFQMVGDRTLMLYYYSLSVSCYFVNGF